MKKIAIITPALVTGGAETMAVRLAVNINKNEYQVKVFCLSEKKNTTLEKILEKYNIDVEYLEKKGKGSVETLIKIWYSLSTFKPDVVHSHISGTIYALPWILFHKCRLVHTVHTKPDEEFSAKFRYVLGWLAKHNKVVIVAVSKENQKIASDYYNIGDKVVYVNNPVEISKYYKNEKEDSSVVFINVSRQDVNKNQILAIKAFSDVYKKVPNAKLILVGDGNQHDTLCKEVVDLGLGNVVNLVGESSEVEKYLADADVYVSTSHREGLPLSMIEAMASKLPIISSDVGGISDLIEGNGLLFEDDDKETFVKDMITLANDEELRKKMGEKSYDIVKFFDVSKCAEKYQEIYDYCIRRD